MNLNRQMCNECGTEYIKNKSLIYDKLLLDESVWDKSDICEGGYCTEKFINAIRENHLTGFMFKPAEDSWNSLKKSEFNLN